MRLNKFEKHIAGKVNEYPSMLDTESLWNNLESDLEKKKKRRIAFILLTLFSMLAIGGITLFQIQTTQNQSITSNTSTIENIEPSVQETTSLVENTSKNENETTALNADANISAITKEFQTQKKRKVVQAINKGSKNVADHTALSSDNTTALNKQTNSTKIEPEPIVGNNNTPITKIENNNTQIARIENIEKIAFLDLTEIDFSKKENNTSAEKNLPKIKPVKNWSLYISSTFGVYYTDRKISQKNENGAILKDLRNRSEKPLETLSLGIGVELKNKNNFFLTSGINFNQITERFNDQSSEFTTENIEIVKEINYLSNGDRQEITGIYEQPQEIVSTTKVYNTLRWTEFYIGGGYYFTKKKWNIGASGGLLWGAMLNAEGKILDAENNIIAIENRNPGIYKNNLGPGAYANLEFRYALQRRLRLSTQVGYKHMPTSFTKEGYPIEIKYQWWGAIVGLHYKIY